jgi:hypothetical protein
MRKVCVILLGLILAFCGNAFAGDINDVSSDKWLDHVSQMQVMRQQILNLLTKPNPTVEDKEMLTALQKSFEEKKTEWDQYLIDVAEGKIKKEKPVQTFCKGCGKRLCDCGKGIICKKCGKRVCNCSKACNCKEDCSGKCYDCNEKGECKCDCQSCDSGKGPYHRYNKKARRQFKHEYHRYNKKCKDACDSNQESVKDCCTPDYSCKTSCTAHKHGKKMAKMSCETSCSSHKQGKKMMKKAYKKSACGSCPSKTKSACASACDEKEVKCNGGIDCPSCPNYKTVKCCKVSGKCSSGHKHGQHQDLKKTEKESACPVCKEYKLMGLNCKCSRCAK